MNPRILAFGLLAGLCSLPVYADTPATGPYDAAEGSSAAAGKTKPDCAPCYNLPNGCPKPKASCQTYDAANPGYFSGIDSTCGLPPGSAIMIASIESACDAGVRNKYGYTGMFQFSTKSCPGVNLRNPVAQATCLCNNVVNLRRDQFFKATGMQASAGMYYLFHQQGGCGLRLALGGNQRAVDVLAACARSSGGMRYAMKAIGANLPRGSGFNASTVTAAQFANIYLSKFKQVDQQTACLQPGGTTPEGPVTPVEPGVPGTGGPVVAGTGVLTASGLPLSQDVVNLIMSDAFYSMFTPLTNPLYEDEANDDDSDTGDSHETVTVHTQPDGSQHVTVVDGGGNTHTFDLNVGQQLWNCQGVYRVSATGQDDSLTAQGCSKLSEAVAPQPAQE